MAGPRIRQRIRILVAGEGDSERGYAGWLHSIADEFGLNLHIDGRACGGGDLLAVVAEVEKLLTREEPRRGPYIHKAILFDTDRVGEQPVRDGEARRKAVELGALLIPQDPDHEGLLLRHLPGCTALRPQRGFSLRRLAQEWPNYRKGLSAFEIGQVLDLECLRRVAGVEPQLRDFLVRIGFPL